VSSLLVLVVTSLLVLVVLLDPFRGRGTEIFHRDPTSQQSEHAPRSETEIKNGGSINDGALERLRCGIINTLKLKL